MKSLRLILPVLVAMVIFSCVRTEKAPVKLSLKRPKDISEVAVPIDKGFSDYIAGYTSGIVSVNAPVEIRFTPEFAAQDPRAFVKEFLVDTLRAQEIYLGRDSRFGRGREGSPETLRALGDAHGFRVTIVPPVTMNGMTVSSTSIRRLLHHGEVEQAAALLRRHYALDGVVSYGTQRGSQLLGFPTANVDVTHELIPKTGVYIGSVAWNGRKFQAVVYVGTNPTFSNARLTVEAHLLDFEGNLYGEWITVALLKRLRDEIAFPDVHALTAQIERDIATARAYFQAQA